MKFSHHLGHPVGNPCIRSWGQRCILLATSGSRWENVPVHLVAHMLKNSTFAATDHNAKAAAQRKADWQADEEKQILREWITEQMKEKSVLLRKQVREAIEKVPP
jgi:hypothetical protein